MKKIFISKWLIASLLFLLPSFSLAGEIGGESLLDLLIEKNLITKKDATEFIDKQKIKKQEEKESQKEFTVIAGKPLKVAAYTQARYQALEETGKIDSFDIRRARLDIKGEITKQFDYRSQIEFGGTKGPLLLDATIGFKADSYLKLTAGQFKIPFSLENLTSSPKLETINRSQVIEALVARGKDVIGNQNGRDVGLQSSGSLLAIENYFLADYAFGIFNGAGINTADTNEYKDFVGRVVLHPVKGFDIGASYSDGFGSWKKKTTDATNTDQNRDRLGAELAYVNESLSLKGEYVRGKDGETEKEGWYFQAGYFVIPKSFQAVVKYDTYNPDTEASENETNIYTFAGNWYFNKWAFLQINYESKKESGTKVNNNAVIGQFTLQI